MRALLAAMRPRQWSKNLLVFAGILFAAELDDPGKWVAAIATFVAYCAASSAAYLFNDVLDAEQDRLHPLKRDRPVASGALTPARALVAAALLATVAFGVMAWFGWPSLAYLAAFLALQAAYSVRLKHVVLIDVIAIAGLFVIRAAAGAEAVNVRISPWLIVCTALLALFLGLAKRRGELVSSGAQGREALDGYSLGLVDGLVAVVAACTVVVYSIYTLNAPEGSAAMAATIPFVAFGLWRYLLLMHREQLGEEPERVLLGDAPILATVAAWAVTSALILGVT